MADAYTHLEAILETAVWRLLAGDTKPGTDGYMETMLVREKLELQEIDYKALSERKYGQFLWIRVRAKRVIGYGDPQQQSNVADWMLEKIQFVEPAARPIIIREAFTLKTGDPDLAEAAIQVPEVILNQQRVIAENEFDTIARRALVGMAVSPQPDDIHNNHIQTHLLDLQALIGGDEVAPWAMKDALAFGGVAEHTGEHIQILIANPATNFEGNQFLIPYQKLIQEAKPVLAGVTEREGSQQNQMTPAEQAQIEIQVAKMELEAQDKAMKWADMEDLQRIRAERNVLANRSQYAQEIATSQKINVDKAKLISDARKPDSSE
jgi:hypothetical protein